MLEAKYTQFFRSRAKIAIVFCLCLNIFRLQEMKRVGILAALERRHYPRRVNDDVPEQPSVTLNTVQTFFVPLGAGFFLAVLFLIIEITIHRMSQDKRNTKPELFPKKHHPPGSSFVSWLQGRSMYFVIYGIMFIVSCRRCLNCRCSMNFRVKREMVSGKGFEGDDRGLLQVTITVLLWGH